MPRPCKLRKIGCNPQVISFRPCGEPAETIENIALTLDELEAIRLADYEGLYQEQAAQKMQISRQTFGNIIASAHSKIADFLINTKQLSIGGGTVEIDGCKLISVSCDHNLPDQPGMEHSDECPKCKNNNLKCVNESNKATNSKCGRNL